MKYWLQYKSLTHVYTRSFDSPLGRELFKMMLMSYSSDMVPIMEWEDDDRYCPRNDDVRIEILQ